MVCSSHPSPFQKRSCPPSSGSGYQSVRGRSFTHRGVSVAIGGDFEAASPTHSRSACPDVVNRSSTRI